MDKCLCCGNDDFDVIATKDNIRFECFDKDKKIVKCKQCGLIQLNPFWSRKELDDLYLNYWHQQDFKGQKAKKKISKYIFKHINNEIDFILEVGCGLGDNIKYLLKNGYVFASGIDKDPNVCNGSFIINKDVFEMDSTEYKYDFIYSIHVLEHMPDTYGFINKLISLLDKDGKIVFEIPNVDDPLLSIYKIKKFERFYWYPYHSVFYNPKTIGGMLKVYDMGYKSTIKLRQEYGIINHLRWLLFGKPGNCNFHIPILDDIYKWILINIFKKTDTMVVIMERKQI